jgi:hypothetical protein
LAGGTRHQVFVAVCINDLGVAGVLPRRLVQKLVEEHLPTCVENVACKAAGVYSSHGLPRSIGFDRRQNPGPACWRPETICWHVVGEKGVSWSLYIAFS